LKNSSRTSSKKGKPKDKSKESVKKEGVQKIGTEPAFAAAADLKNAKKLKKMAAV
jgi:hypothetical protein